MSKNFVKHTSDLCPCCGGDNVCINDMEYDGDSLRLELYCEDCEDVSWNEYFALRYVGYAMDGVDYDSNGNKEE